MKRKRAIIGFLLSTMVTAPLLHAEDISFENRRSLLVHAFEKAQENDPQFRASLAEFDANIISSKIAGAAYFPQLSITSSQIEDEDGDQRHIASLIQPLISADKYATLKEKKPRAQIAIHTLQLRRYDLAMRLYQIFSDLTTAQEGLEQNKARMNALKHQYDAGKRTFELGQGTVTDMADAKVKMLQAEADDLNLRNELQAAREEYLSIVGELPPDFRLSKQLSPSLTVRETNSFEETTSDNEAIANNPEVKLANLNRRLAELDSIRARSAWLPELNASYTYTSLDGEDDSFIGLSLSMPINASKLYGTQSASSNLNRLNEEALDKRRQTRLEIQRLTSAVQTGLVELSTRQQAIEAAELSVTSNEKSYKGGVRSLLDVLTSIDVLYSIQAEYVSSALKLGENFLKLQIQQGQDVIKSLRDVERTVLSLNSEY